MTNMRYAMWVGGKFNQCWLRGRIWLQALAYIRYYWTELDEEQIPSLKVVLSPTGAWSNTFRLSSAQPHQKLNRLSSPPTQVVVFSFLDTQPKVQNPVIAWFLLTGLLNCETFQVIPDIQMGSKYKIFNDSSIPCKCLESFIQDAKLSFEKVCIIYIKCRCISE